jgi:phage tail protein X
MADRIIGYKQYITAEGDTFDALALDMYGDEKLSSRIIEFNPDYADVIIFGGNIKLMLPVYDEDEAGSLDTLPPWR